MYHQFLASTNGLIMLAVAIHLYMYLHFEKRDPFVFEP